MERIVCMFICGLLLGYAAVQLMIVGNTLAATATLLAMLIWLVTFIFIK